MSESNFNVIPAINTVDGFNPADFVRTTVGEEGENDLYLDVKYRLLWFRLHHPNGKIDPKLIRVDEKNAIVCCRIYADKADPADQFIGRRILSVSQRKTALAIASWRLPKRSQRAVLWLMRGMVHSSV